VKRMRVSQQQVELEIILETSYPQQAFLRDDII